MESFERAGTLLVPERVAYWYFRLNGFLQIENFIIHPSRKGGQRTDADLIGVRFPFRREMLFDGGAPMDDDTASLCLCEDKIDVVITEVKTNGPCSLNGPWTKRDRANVQRLLAAIGCLEANQIEDAAKSVYDTGAFATDTVHIRLAALAARTSDDLFRKYPKVVQLEWPQVAEFIWTRFHVYRCQKTDVDQWNRGDRSGFLLKQLADGTRGPEEFLAEMAKATRIGLG